MKKIGIIGGSGFIGSHVTQQFLNHGFEVKVSTTDISKKEKYEHLMKLNNSDYLHISELDVTNEALLTEFVKDCDIVIHGGTPFLLDVKDPKSELFDPTIKGTENFLTVINKTPAVKKVVFIASVAAWNTNFPMPPDGKTFTDTISEKDIPFISIESHPYAQAKFIANQTVNDFIKNNPNIDFEITSVSPVAVMGKSLSNREDSTSTGIQFLIKNKIVPDDFMQMLFDNDVEFAMVDVKDVADAVYRAATKTNLHGKNYLLSSETYAVSDISYMLNNEKPANEPKIIYSNSLAIKDLGVHFKPAQVPLFQFNA